MCIYHLLYSGDLFGNFDVLWGDIDQAGMEQVWPGESLFCALREYKNPHTTQEAESAFFQLSQPLAFPLTLGVSKCNVQMMKNIIVTPKLYWQPAKYLGKFMY